MHAFVLYGTFGFLLFQALLWLLRPRTAAAETRAGAPFEFDPTVSAFLSDAVIYTDPGYVILAWNQAAERIYGWSAEEAIGQRMIDLIPTEFPSDDIGVVRDAFQKVGRWQGEVRQRARNGEWKIIHSSVVVVPGEHGSPDRLVAINRNVTGMRATETALYESRSYLAAVIENSSDPIVALELDSTVTVANSAFRRLFHRLFGRQIEIGRPIAAFVPPEILEQFRDFAALDAEALPVTREYDLKVGDQRVVSRLSVNQIRDEADEVQGVTVLVTDITAHREMVAALRQSEAHLRATIASVPDLVFILNREGVYLEVQAAPSHQPLTPLIGRRLRDVEVLPPDVARAIEERLHAALDGDQVERIEYTLAYPNDPSHYEARLSRVDDERVLMLVRDISEQKQAADLLRENEARYRRLLEDLPEAVTLHRNGTIVYLNPAAVAILGAESAESLYGRSIFEFVLPEYHALVEERQKRIAAGQEEMEPAEMEIRSLTGEVRTIETHAVRSSFDGRNATQVVIRDITRRKEAEARLHASAAFQSELARLVTGLLQEEVSPALYQRILESACRAIPGAESGTLLLRQENGRFHPAALVGRPLDPQMEQGVSQRQIERALTTPPKRVEKPHAPPAGPTSAATGTLFPSLGYALVAPIRVGAETIAVLALDGAESGHQFDRDAAAMARVFGAEVALVLRQLQTQAEERIAARGQTFLARMERRLVQFDSFESLLPLLAYELLEETVLNVDVITLFRRTQESTLQAQIFARDDLDPAAIHADLEEAGLLDPTSERSILRRAVMLESPYYDPDVQARDEWLTLPSNPLRSLLLLPLRLGGQLWGVVQISSRMPAAFSERTIALLGQIFSGTEVALDRQADRRRLELELAKMKAVVSVNEALRLAATREEVLAESLRNLAALTGADAGNVMLYDRPVDQLVVRATHVLAPTLRLEDRVIRLDRGTGAAWLALDADRTVALQGTEAAAVVHLPRDVPPAHAYMATPLHGRDGRPIGVVCAYQCISERGFDDSDRAFLEAIAQACDSALVRLELIAESVERAAQYESLYRQAERQTRELRLLDQVRNALSEALELDDLIRTVVESIGDQLGYERVSIHLIEGDELVPRHQRGHEQPLKRAPVNAGTSGQVIRRREPMLVAERRGSGEAEERSASLVEELTVPLFDEGRVVGVLRVESQRAGLLTSDDLRLMVALGSQIGVALERARLFTTVRQSEQRFRLLAENMSDLICLHQPDGSYLYLSPSCKQLLGYEPDELLGSNPLSLIHPEDSHAQDEAAQALEDNPGGRQSVIYRIRRRSGEYIWCETVVQAIRDDEGKVKNYVTSSRDVTDRKLAEDQLIHGALYDELTGLPNRALFMDRLQHIIDRCIREPEVEFAVLFLDVDRFKVINDSLGHSVGDRLLVELGRRLLHCVRGADTVARLGGDEFAVLLEDLADPADARLTAARILETVRRPLSIEGHEVFTSASIGITRGPAGYQKPDELLRDADIAMYRAKNQGRARVTVFDTSMHARAVQRQQLESDLRRSVEQHELSLVYQPVFDLAADRTIGFEALLRWNRPGQGPIPPAEFLPVAIEMGLVAEIGDWVLQSATAQLAAWERELALGGDLTMSVNLAAQQFMVGDLMERVEHFLSESGLNPRRLALEITESTIMQNAESAAVVLRQLRARGVQTQLDDFGTGYSSLSYLHRFPLDALKIDQSFVGRMTEAPQNAEIIHTIVALARNLSLEVVAEGIESQEQLDALRALGCNSGQGYFLARPMTPDQIAAWWRRHSR